MSGIHLLTSEENKPPDDMNRWCTCDSSSLNESREVEVEVEGWIRGVCFTERVDKRECWILPKVTFVVGSF